LEEIMSMNELNVELREGTGKGICRRLRSAGMVPGIIYGKGFNPTAVSINLRELAKTIETAGGESSLITLAGEKTLKGAVVIVSDMLLDPIKGTPRHIDLHKLNMDEKVRVEVKIKLTGTAKGVKDGGLLEFVKHTVEIECLPAFIPAHIDVDVTELTLGHSIHLSEIQLPANVKLIDDPKASIVSVLGRAKEEAPAAEA
jgi:large subunit ribosomal protein L25